MKRPHPVALALAGMALVLLAALAFNAHHAAWALHCARASDGTYQAIADCYTRRGLPCPEDICSNNQE